MDSDVDGVSTDDVEPVLRVTVNQSTCEGTGFCEQVAGAVFRVSPAGVSQPQVDEVPEPFRDAALAAEAMCPTRSIRVLIEGW